MGTLTQLHSEFAKRQITQKAILSDIVFTDRDTRSKICP